MAGIGSFGGVGDILLYLGVVDAGFSSKLAGAKAQADQLAGNIQNVMNKAIIAGGAAFATAAISAMKFESAFAGVTKTVDGLRDPMGKLNKDGEALAQQFRDLALEIPVSVNELARIGELGGQLGIPKASLIEFTDTIAKLGVTTNLTAEQGSSDLARFINITKQIAPAGMDAGEQIARIGSTVVELGNNFATTEAEVVDFAMRIAGAGAQIGLSQSEILSFGAALSSVGLNAEAGGTAISKLFINMANSIANGDANLKRFADISGVTIDEFKQKFETDAAGAVTMFITGMGEMSKSGENVFGVLEDLGYTEVRLRDAILRSSAASDLMTKSFELGSKAYQENTALTKEASQRFETLEKQLGLTKNIVQDAFISIGNGLLPALSGIIKLLNEHPYAVQVAVKSFAEFAMIIGTVAAGFKIYNAGSKLIDNANLLMKKSFGPVGFALTGITLAIIAVIEIIKAHEKAVLKNIAATSDEITAVEKLGKRYNELTNSGKLTGDQQKELKDVTQKLEAQFKSVGLDVEKYKNNLGDLIEQYKEIRKQQLTDDLEKLNQQIKNNDERTAKAAERGSIWNSVLLGIGIGLGNASVATQNYSAENKKLQTQVDAITNEMNELNTSQKYLNELGIQTTPQIKEEIAVHEAKLLTLKKNSYEYNQLQLKINDLKEKIGQAVPVVKEMKSAQELLEEAGIKSTNMISAQLVELKAIHPIIKDDKYAMGQYRQQLSDFHKEVAEGMKNIKDWGGYTEHITQTKEWKDSLEKVSGSIRSSKFGVDEMAVAMKEAAGKTTNYNDQLKLAKEIVEKKRLALIDYVPVQKDSTEEFKKAVDAVRNYGSQIIDAAGSLGAFGGKTDVVQKAFANFVNDLKDTTAGTLHHFGAGLQSAGSLISAFSDKGDKASQTVGLLTNTLGTVLRGGFDPLSLGISVVTGLFGIFGGKAKEVNRTMEEVTAIVAKAGIDIEGLNKTIEGLEFDSPLLDQMKSQMDSIMEAMRTAVGSTFKNLQWELKQLTDQMEILLQPFELKIEIDEAISNLDKVISSIMTNYKFFDNPTYLLSYNKELEAQLSIFTGLLSQVKEGTPAYTALKDAIDKIVTALNELNGVSGTTNDGIERRVSALQSEYNANEIYRKSLQDQLDAEYLLQDAGQDRSREIAALEKELEGLYYTQAALTEEIKKHEAAIKNDTKTVTSATVAAKELDLSWKNQRQTMQQSGEDAIAVSGKYADMNKTIETTNTVLRELKINWGSALEGAMTDFNTFEANAKTVAKTMEDMLYFKVDFDTTTADEQISATLQSMYLYLQSLDPASQAYLDAEESLKKLIDQFVAMGGILPPYIADLAKQTDTTNAVASATLNLTKGIQINRTAIDNQKIALLNSRKELERTQKELANYNAILTGLYAQKNEIRVKFYADKADMEKQIADWQATYDSLTAEKKAINLEFDLKIGETAGSIGELQDVFEMLDRGEWGADNLYEVSKILERITGQAQVLTIDWEDMLDVMFADYSNMTKDLETAGKALDQMEFFAIKFADTEVDEQIGLAILRMNDFIGTLDKSSPAFKQAKTNMDNLIVRFLQLSGKELPAVVKQFIAYQKEIEATKDKIEALQKEKIQIDLDIADFKKQRDVLYKTINDLEKQRIDIDIKLAEDTTKINKEIADAADFITASNKKKIEIDLKLKEDTEKIKSEIKSVTQSLNDLYEKRDENIKQYRETNNQVRTLNGYLTEMASKDPAALANINLNEMWRLITGINSEVTALGLEWDKTWATIFGDFDTFFKYDESTGWKLGDQIQDVLDKMSFFKVDFDTTSMDEQLNALIFRMQDFIGTLDPNSEAYKEADRMLQGFIAKFQALGGVLDENAAKDLISNEGEDALAILQKQLADLKLEDNKIDFDITEAQKKIVELNQELKDLAQKAIDDKALIDLDISLAKAKILALNQELLDLAQKALDEKAQIDLDIENALLAISDIDTKLAELELRKPQIDLDISAAQARIIELEQLLLDFDLTQFLDKEAALALQTQQVNTEIEALETLLSQLIGDKSEYNLKVDADIAAASQKIMELTQQLFMLQSDFNDMDMQIDVNIANALSKIAELQGAIDGLTGKTIVIGVENTMHAGGAVMHTGGWVGGYLAHSGGDIPAILQRDEYVIQKDTVAKFDRSQWDNLNVTGNPTALLGNSGIGTGQGAIAVNTHFDVNIHSADPNAWAEIIKKEIAPGVNRINRKFVVESNPYNI